MIFTMHLRTIVQVILNLKDQTTYQIRPWVVMEYKVNQFGLVHILG